MSFNLEQISMQQVLAKSPRCGTHAFKVDQHSLLNGLNHKDSAVKTDEQIYVDVFVFLLNCTSTEGTYHRHFLNCAQFPMFRLWAKILKNKWRFKCSYLKIYT